MIEAVSTSPGLADIGVLSVAVLDLLLTDVVILRVLCVGQRAPAAPRPGGSAQLSLVELGLLSHDGFIIGKTVNWLLLLL